MDEKTVREHLDEVTVTLRRNEEEHDVLLTLVKGYEGWLRLHGGRSNGQQEITFATAPYIGWHDAIRRVLKDAVGEPLHVKEIWIRAQGIGLKTKAKNPLGLVDLTCRRLHGVEKTDPRTSSWAGN